MSTHETFCEARVYGHLCGKAEPHRIHHDNGWMKHPFKSTRPAFRDAEQRTLFEIGLQTAMRGYLLDTVPMFFHREDYEALVEDMAEAATEEMLRFHREGERPRED